jgi:hypothetical protein
MNDEVLWARAAENHATLQSYETKAYLTKHRKRFLLTMPEAIAEKVKTYANELRAEYDAQVLADAKRDTIAKWKAANPLPDWIEREAISRWANR